MTDQDPSKEKERNAEQPRQASQEIVQALADITRYRESIVELDSQSEDAASEVSRLEAQLAVAREERAHIGVEKFDLTTQHRNATLDAVRKLAEVVGTHNLTVEEALELVKNTVSQLDQTVLSDSGDRSYTWRDKIPAIRPIDYGQLVATTEALRGLPEGEFIGYWERRNLYIAQPVGDPKLLLSESITRGPLALEDGPFPYTAEISVGIARTDPQSHPESFTGDILVGSEAIIERALKGKTFDYKDQDGEPLPAEKLLESYFYDQKLLQNLTDHEMFALVDDGRRRDIRKTADKSHAGFRAGISQRVAGIYGVEQNLKDYTTVLGQTYFSQKDVYRTVELISAIYGDGSQETRVNLAAYTKVLADKFDESGKLPEDVIVTDLERRQAAYYLTYEKAGE